MENLTHSLLGVTLAELALPRDATRVQRRLFFVAGIVAANLPDGDLLYARITPPPLGYLLHHRGHTHTLVGCAGLAALIWLVARVIPPVRRTIAESPNRFWALIATALLSHLLADSWNSYGVHPFWPVDNRWFYGDAIFILEPWFWVILGAAAALNTRAPSGKRILMALVVALPVVAAGLHLTPTGAAVALVIGCVAIGAVMRRLQPRARSALALAGVAMFVAGMLGLNRVAMAASLSSLRGVQQGKIIDVVLSPGAAQPFCWSALAVEEITASGEYVLRRGQVSLFARQLGDACGAGTTSRVANSGGISDVVWDMTLRESLLELRQRSHDDCWVRAWLQFGRAPVLRDNLIADLRYGTPGSGGFTEMKLRPLAEAQACPPYLTNWGMPRKDLGLSASKN